MIAPWRGSFENVGPRSDRARQQPAPQHGFSAGCRALTQESGRLFERRRDVADETPLPMAPSRDNQDGSSHPRTWVMMGHKAGDNSQILALAEGLGWPFEIKHLVYRPTELLTNLLAPLTLLGIVRQKSSPLAPPWPDLIISAGRRNEPPCRWIQARADKRVRLVPRRPPLGADREFRSGGHHAAVPAAQAAERAAQYHAVAAGRP